MVALVVKEGVHVLLLLLALVLVVRAQQLGEEQEEVLMGYHLCCDINTTDALCFNTCIEAVGDSSQITSLQIQALSSACSPFYTSFWMCVNVNFNVTNEIVTTQPPPVSEHYRCCFEEGNTNVCKEACQRYLATGEVVDNIAALVGACGSHTATPLSPFWNCVWNSPPSEPPTEVEGPIPAQPRHADWARVQCCNKAYDQECRKYCLELYTGGVSSLSWSRFQLDCIHRPSESRLSTCMADVGSPCKVGCTGPRRQDQLTFCTNFNNRPSESFRQCNNAADRMAKNIFYQWIRTGVVQHPLHTLFVSNLENCLTDMWKTVACITHIQPCHPTTHITQICRQDCLKLLSTCSKSDVAPQALCDIIAPASTEKHCISVSDYLTPSPVSYKQALVIENPCDPNPCAEGYFCAINHKCQENEQGCTKFSCQPGCIIGDRPSFVVPEYSGVRVNLVTDSDHNCYGYFNCSTVREGTSGRTDVSSATIGGTGPRGFQPIHTHCENGSVCYVDGSMIAHGHRFKKDCNYCTCSHGRLICTNRLCLSDNDPTYNCSECSNEFEPVCTIDGRTLPNSCYAECMGYKRGKYTTGRDCRATDPCSTGFGRRNRCGNEDSCLPTRKICFFNSSEDTIRDCKQYTCVNQDNCTKFLNPVCDNLESAHTSLCSFLRTHSQLDYLGYCKPECSRSRAKEVCGVNGETFPTECHSDSDNIAVDYYGHCKSIPGSGSDGKSCDNVACPAMPHPRCVGVTPWDACCPKCGGHITVLLDNEIMQRNILALGLESISSVDIIQRLRYHISSLQCNLYGHFSLDGSLSLLVLPTLNTSLELLIGSCNQEAVKLATFINNHTPMLASDPYLSHMVAATVKTATLKEEKVVDVDGSSAVESSLYSAAQPLAGGVSMALAALISLLLQVTLVHLARR